MKLPLLLTPLLLLLCIGTQPIRADSRTVGGKPENLIHFVPLNGFTGQPLVQVKVNGTVDATFLLDTGSTTSVIQNTLASQLGVKPYPNGEIVANGKQFALFAPRLELGRFNFPDTPAILLNENQMSVVTKKFSGIIGMSILRLFAVVFDFQSNTILMIGDGNLSADELKEQGFDKAACLPLSYNKDRIPVVRAIFVNGTHQGTEALSVDTGFDATQISNGLAHDLNLPVIQEGTGAQGLTGQFAQSVSHVTMELGDMTLPSWEVLFASSDKVKVSPALGVNALSHYRVLIDFPASKMYLAPPAPITVMVKPSGTNAPSTP